jgi:citrate lyase subunit beta / citryl-CoA lyase
MGEPTRRRPESALRSWLFTPGSDARKLAKASTSDADALILDLEDAVADSKKAEARTMVAAEIRQHGGSGAVYIRVNAVPTGLIADDLAAITMPELAGIWLPKAETVDEVRHTDDLLTKLETERGMSARSVNLLLSFETARGVQDAYAVASASKRVTAVSAGTAEGGDLHAEIGGLWSDDVGTVPFVRTRVALAGRAAGLRCIIDGACTRLDDGTVARSAEAARQAGYSGKMAIHPRHIAVIHHAFAPTAEEVSHANEVIKAFAAAEAAGTAAISVGGRMIDYAMVVNARRVLAEAEARGPGEGAP